MKRGVTAAGGVVARSLLLAGVLGCGGGDTGTQWSSEQIRSSAHFVYHARPDDGSIGSEVLGYLEANAGLIAQGQLGLAPNAWGPVHYSKYRDAPDFAAKAPCGQVEMAQIEGCNVRYSDGRIEVHSPSAVDGHELVHAYAFSLGVPPTLLIEGLAVALSCSPGVETVALDAMNGRISPVLALKIRRPRDVGFSTLLLRRGGSERAGSGRRRPRL